MTEAIRRITKSRILKEQITEAGYVGNIGIMELVKFQQKASQKQKDMLQSFIKKKKNKEAWNLVQDVTGMKLHKSVTEQVYRGDWVRHPENQWNIGQIQSIDNDQALVTWKKIDKRKKAVSSTHHVKDLQHARREFSQLKQPTHHKESVSPDILPKAGAGAEGTATLVNTYKNDTPGQGRKIKRFKEFN